MKDLLVGDPDAKGDKNQYLHYIQHAASRSCQGVAIAKATLTTESPTTPPLATLIAKRRRRHRCKTTRYKAICTTSPYEATTPSFQE